ncbi:Farnesyl pyrophosphate synthetase [Coemansia sp. RSA 1807]|nr:Farnesyl pyrophosphate synthetase [Coemansia sp. RSA 2167]KAJ2154335.1 Farnesyl pyrophosphate synthetase [Coemansia sp. RSA 637]KAJ2167651.1 Farnesyl pyrophosphate synthetase [Coemansia sp. RSA 562]KAJ2174359.1 Farnesyl pyrophosphate synthetase [Coemansia sp. RSA 560]KAJ2191393.1 Farnesyl pyrophosphate synthetase [Coemansia sp. RSA 532]KAJ2198883.1 Farnesyl pyrophosphate synthetase [Coemansia sp. RSA 522]KAJ2205782.1 Farnesyl pyrophosphate synthetase [Coemansia sp. RSA 521]KAJ2221547.1 Fa
MSTTRAEFNEFFPQLTSVILSELPSFGATPEMVTRIKSMIEYNVMGGKMNRGLSVVDTVKIMRKETELPQDVNEKAMVLGWAVEWLQAFFLVADDIMDESPTRRGQPAWYRRPDVGILAINDAFILESCIYRLLKRYFRSEPYYIDLVELIHETSYQTELGQMVDLLTAPENDINLDRFSIEKHAYIVEYKTAYYSFYLPVAMALMMTGTPVESPVYQVAKDILIPLGVYFQVQDDYLDCYGEPELIGKIGTDIEDNKCSWLVVQALDRVSAEQRNVLNDNYGRKQPAVHAERVKELYKELDIEGVYKAYEDKAISELEDKIAKVDESLVPRAVFTAFLNKVAKRTK